LAHELLSCGFELTSKDPAAEQFVVQIRNLNYYYGQGRIVHAGVAQHQSGFAEGPDCTDRTFWFW